MGRTPTDPSTHSVATNLQRVKCLTDMHRQLALLVALGHSNKAIAQELGMKDTVRISVIRNSEPVKELIKKYQSAIAEKSIIESISRRLASEVDPSIDKLASLREDGVEEGTQLSAAKFLLEKAVDTFIPKKSITEEVKKVGVVVLSAEDAERLMRVAKEDQGAIDVTPEE